MEFDTSDYRSIFFSEPKGRKRWGFFLFRKDRRDQGHPDERAVRFETGECDWKRAKKKATKMVKEIGRDFALVYWIREDE